MCHLIGKVITHVIFKVSCYLGFSMMTFWLYIVYNISILVCAGLLRGFFDILYDEDIITEDAFLKWEKSEETPEGKVTALKQVVQFFKWLKEDEEDIWGQAMHD